MQFNLHLFGRAPELPDEEIIKADDISEPLVIPEEAEIQKFLVGETNKKTSDILEGAVRGVVMPMSGLWDRLPKKDNREGEHREALRGDKIRSIGKKWGETPKKEATKDESKSPLAKILDRIEAVVPEAGEHRVLQDFKNSVAVCRKMAGGDDLKKEELYNQLREQAYSEFEVLHRAVTDWEAKPR